MLYAVKNGPHGMCVRGGGGWRLRVRNKFILKTCKASVKVLYSAVLRNDIQVYCALQSERELQISLTDQEPAKFYTTKFKVG